MQLHNAIQGDNFIKDYTTIICHEDLSRNINAAHVEYDKPIPNLRKFFIEINKVKALEENLEKLTVDLKKFTFDVVTKKHSSWKYKKETRLLLTKAVGRELFPFKDIKHANQGAFFTYEFYSGCLLKLFSISFAVSRAVLKTPINVAEAYPVQSP